MSGKKLNAVPVWAKLGHHKPVTRRELLAAGVLGFSASMLVPRLSELILPRASADVGVCSPPRAGMIPFITINLSGGAGLGANYVPLDRGGQLLPTYSKIGLGSTSSLPIEREFGNVPFAGRVGGRLISQFLQGIRETAPNALPKTAFAAICAQSQSDSSSNQLSCDGLLAKVGLAGTLLPNLGSHGNTQTGVLQAAAVASPPTPLIVSSFKSLSSAISYDVALRSLKPAQQQALARFTSRLSDTQLAKLNGLPSEARAQTAFSCAGIKNEELVLQGSSKLDPRLDVNVGASLSRLWGISSSTPTQDDQLVFGSMVYNGLTGQAGSVAFELGGYDYHDGTRTTGDSKDLAAGQQAGRVLESAFLLGKPVFLYICTDGSLSATESSSSSSPFFVDRPSGVNYILYFNPAGRVASTGFQIGCYVTGQDVDNTTATGSSVPGAACAAFANYLAVNNRLDLFDAATNRIFNTSQMAQVVKFAA